ncbi:hypothetical protein [Treponema lecithinolyticum]
MEKKFAIEFYEKESGEKPCLEFLNKLEVKLRVKVFRDMSLLEEKGREFRLPYSNYITHGFRKKTPPEEIEKAKKYRADYLVRNLHAR